MKDTVLPIDESQILFPQSQPRFNDDFDDLIIDAIKSSVPGIVDELIETEGNAILKSLVLSAPIDKYAKVNFDLTQNPSSTQNELNVFLSGEVVKA